MKIFSFLFVFLSIPALQATPRQTWIDQMEGKVPEALCQAKYFAQCYKIPTSECTKIAKRSVHQCIEQQRKNFPAQFDANSGRQWGEKVGACAGEDLEKKLASKKIKSKKCEHPTF